MRKRVNKLFHSEKLLFTCAYADNADNKLVVNVFSNRICEADGINEAVLSS